jgi:hypothetical protein
MYFADLTELCLYGVMTGFGLSFIVWAIGVVPRAFKMFLR